MTADAPLVLSQGDPSGIGPEITLKVWTALRETGPVFAVLGAPDLYRWYADHLKMGIRIVEIGNPRQAAAHFATGLPVLPAGPPLAAPVPGHSDPAHAGGVVAAIERGVAASIAGEALGLVTLPITKAALYDTGFPFPGHTEFLAHLGARISGQPERRPVMMLASPRLRVVPLTIHEPLHMVPTLLDRMLIVETGRIVLEALRSDFGISAPRLAVAGLNPHAGESGTIGREDTEIIAPAVAALAAEGYAVTGPHAADTLFHEEARQRYDAALCMYHDQALIPIKTLDFDAGVNVTLGLPFVRTSPDHGTAHDIAGQGVARPDALIAAIRMAHILGRRRLSGRGRR